MKFFRVLVVFWLVSVFSLSNLSAEPITEIRVFGDSLSDQGNAYQYWGVNQPPSPPYYDGRFSNGPVWLKRSAELLGIEVPTCSLDGGTNHAYGGAQTGTGTSWQGTPNMGAQLDTYMAAPSHTASTLFVFWGGANDVFATLDEFGTIPDPAALITTSVTNLVQMVGTVAAAGGKQFLVPNMPPLGETPWGQTLTPEQRGGLNVLCAGFGSALAGGLDQLESDLAGAGLTVTIYQPDVYGMFWEAIDDPGEFGLTNVTDPFIYAPAGANGDEYLFWDDVHPTARGHEILGEYMVPEPSSLVLLATAGIGLIVLAWRRRLGGPVS